MISNQNTTISLVLDLQNEKLAHLRTASPTGFHTPKSELEKRMVQEDASGNAPSWCKQRHGMISNQNTTISLVLDLPNEKLAHLRTASATGFHTPKSELQRRIVQDLDLQNEKLAHLRT